MLFLGNLNEVKPLCAMAIRPASRRNSRVGRAAVTHEVDHRSVVALIANCGKGYGARPNLVYYEG